MKTNKLKYVWFVLILSIFCLALFLARGRTKIEMRNRIYSQWSQQFLVTKGDQSYVRTTNDSEGTTVLSEAQSYGMLITVLAAQKGKRHKQILRIFIAITKIIVSRERS